MNYRSKLFFAVLTFALSVQPAFSGTLKFSAKVPKPPSSLPLIKLTPQPAPTDLINRFLSSSKEEVKLAPLSEAPFLRKNDIKVPVEMVGVVEDEHVKAWANLSTGDAAIYPTLNKLNPISKADEASLASRTQEIFSSPQFIAKDDTRFVVDQPQLLNGATLVRDDKGETKLEKPAEAYIAYVSARRFVGDYPVDGVGSRALLEIGNGGSVEGLTRVWKSGKIAQTVRSSLSAKQVQDAIARQLKPALRTSDIVVDSISLAYYDANQKVIQPVYRFTARIRHVSKDKVPPTSDDFVIGYVPYTGKAFEPLPSLESSQGPNPTKASTKELTQMKRMPPAPANDPLVGRYVVRNDDAGWVNDANAFWSTLSSTWTGSLFTNSQYYWAEPRLFTNQKNSFINAMNLSLIEAHGDWWLFSTLKNCCDLVNINGDIPSPGYGPSANGKLADWVIHSCEVVPAPEDTAQWPAPWWNIFGGVRNVVGYRTIMYISDGAGGPYGTSLGNLAPVVSSWLSDVISLNAYSGHPKAEAHGGIMRPMGRPSTISMCGHDSDSVLSTSTLGRANCLTVWWFPD
jgi:hypothetical protein